MIDKNVFLKNTLLLTFTALALNVISMIFRIYISGRIGADGLGLFTLIISIYSFAATFAASGISLSVTRLVSESKGSGANASEILYKAMLLALSFGVLAAICLFCFSDFISMSWISDNRAVLPLKILSLSLPFFSISSCLNGYFIANRKIFQVSKWQFAEQVSQMLFTILFLSVFPADNIQTACCGIVISSVLGEFVSCLYGFILYDRLKEPYQKTSCKVYKNIFFISGPIALSSYFRAGLMTLENILIPRGFSKLNHSRESALSQYGVLKGMSMPAISFPSAILSSISSLLIPEIAEAASLNHKKQVKHLSEITIRGTFLYSILTLSVFVTFGQTLGISLFKNEQSGLIMHIIAWAIPLIYLDSVADSILKAVNEQVASLKYNTVEGISRILLLYTLIPLFGIHGFIIVVFVSNLFSALLGLLRILKVLKVNLLLRYSVVLPSIFAAISAYFSRTIAFYFFHTPILQTIVGILLLCLSYCTLILYSGILLKNGVISSRFCSHMFCWLKPKRSVSDSVCRE